MTVLKFKTQEYGICHLLLFVVCKSTEDLMIFYASPIQDLVVSHLRGILPCIIFCYINVQCSIAIQRTYYCDLDHESQAPLFHYIT